MDRDIIASGGSQRMVVAVEQTPRMTNVTGAARYLAMSESWIRAAVAKKRLPCIRLGKSLRFLYRDLDNFLEARRTGVGL